jgi:hypothetical protein
MEEANHCTGVRKIKELADLAAERGVGSTGFLSCNCVEDEITLEASVT